MAQRLLCLANIALGELRAYKVPEVSYVALLCCSDNQNFDIRPVCAPSAPLFEALATGQVGTLGADTGIAWVRNPPLPQG